MKKRCASCQKRLPKSAFGVDRNRSDGLHPYCRECKNRKARGDYAASEEIREHKKQYRVGWYATHREEQNVRTRAWQKDRWENDPEYRERERARTREYDKTRRPEVRAKWRKETGNAQRRGRYKNDPEFRKRIDSINRQREHARRAPGSFTQGQWTKLCSLAKGKCLACRKRVKLTVDHIVPVSKGGTSEITNIQPLCEHCNKSKGTKSKDYRSRRLKRWAKGEYNAKS